MPRPRLIPDADIFAAILRLIAADGEKAVAFSAVARATGLAAPSLVQRYGTLQDMLHATFMSEWDRLDALTDTALTEVDAAGKGPQALLKSLGSETSAALLAASQRDAALRERAANWRNRVEAALEGKLRDPTSAAMLFAAWQGQLLWQSAGDKGFKLKDALKRLA
ncbi:MAG: transcriptional regulator [Paracoccaceae bacterium]